MLLVEDHRPFRQALALVLGLEGLPVEVDQAGSLSAAARLVRLKDGYDAAIVDLGLPDGDGLELVRELRSISPGTAVAGLTVSLDPEDHAEALEAGAEVLSKEGPLPEIVAAVGRLAGAYVARACRSPGENRFGTAQMASSGSRRSICRPSSAGSATVTSWEGLSSPMTLAMASV